MTVKGSHHNRIYTSRDVERILDEALIEAGVLPQSIEGSPQGNIRDIGDRLQLVRKEVSGKTSQEDFGLAA